MKLKEYVKTCRKLEEPVKGNALRNAEIWSNTACIGYLWLAFDDAILSFLDEKQKNMIVQVMKHKLNSVSIDEAEKHY